MHCLNNRIGIQDQGHVDYNELEKLEESPEDTDGQVAVGEVGNVGREPDVHRVRACKFSNEVEDISKEAKAKSKDVEDECWGFALWCGRQNPGDEEHDE